MVFFIGFSHGFVFFIKKFKNTKQKKNETKIKVVQDFFIVMVLPDSSSLLNAIIPLFLKASILVKRTWLLSPRVRHKLRKQFEMAKEYIPSSHASSN